MGLEHRFQLPENHAIREKYEAIGVPHSRGTYRSKVPQWLFHLAPNRHGDSNNRWDRRPDCPVIIAPCHGANWRNASLAMQQRALQSRLFLGVIVHSIADKARTPTSSFLSLFYRELHVAGSIREVIEAVGVPP